MPSSMLSKIATSLTIFFPVFYMLGNATADIALSLIALSFLLHSCISKDFSWLKKRWVQFGIALYILMVARSLFADHVYDSLSRSAFFIRYIIFTIALSEWIMCRENIARYTLYAIISFSVFLSLNGILQYFVGFNMFGYAPIEHINFVRLTNLMGEKMNIGMLVCFISFPGIVYCTNLMILKNTQIWQKLLAFSFIVMTIIVVVLSGERLAFLLLIFGICLMMVLYKNLRRYTIIGIIILASITSTLLAYNKDIFARQYEYTSQTLKNFKTSDYGQVFTISFNIFKDYPIFGIGAKQYRHLCLNKKYHPFELNEYLIFANCKGHPHNIYLELMAETGLIGLIIFLGMIFCWYRKIYTIRDNVIKDPVLCGIIIALIIKIWPISSSGSLFIAWANSTIWFMSGWALSYTNITKTNKKLRC